MATLVAGDGGETKRIDAAREFPCEKFIDLFGGKIV